MIRIKSFTIAEIMMAMLLTSILILITYKVYNNVQVYVLNSINDKHKKSELLFRTVLMNDFRNASVVRSIDSGFVCTKDSAHVIYTFTDSLIIRRGLIEDTFKFRVNERKLWNDTLLIYSNNEVVDKLELILEINKEVRNIVERRHGASKEYFKF
jgi:hypothetical protein